MKTQEQLQARMAEMQAELARQQKTDDVNWLTKAKMEIKIEMLEWVLSDEPALDPKWVAASHLADLIQGAWVQYAQCANGQIFEFRLPRNKEAAEQYKRAGLVVAITAHNARGGETTLGYTRKQLVDALMRWEIVDSWHWSRGNEKGRTA